MDPEQRQQWQQTANRMTVFCLISLVLGAYIIWVNGSRTALDATATMLPLAVVGVVHLLGGSIAIYSARRTGNILRNLPVYGYFLLAAVLAGWLITTGVR
jgi:hypothetical protein